MAPSLGRHEKPEQKQRGSKSELSDLLCVYGKTPNMLWPALRQYQHNDCSGLLAGFDYDEIIKIVATLKKQEEESQTVAAEAYQVIGVLADCQQLFDSKSVQNALDYFGDIANGERGERFKSEILPFTL